MTDIEVLLADIGEVTTKELAKKKKVYGLEENREIAKIGGEIAKNTKSDIESKLGESVISKKNMLTYQYIEENELMENN